MSPRLMQEVELRTRLADAGRKRALNAYAWSVVVGQYMGLYENIAGRGPEAHVAELLTAGSTARARENNEKHFDSDR